MKCSSILHHDKPIVSMLVKLMWHTSSISVHVILVLALQPVVSEKNLDLTVSLTVACVISHQFPNGAPAVVFSVFLRNTETP